jgi:predicted amidohydrolase
MIRIASCQYPIEAVGSLAAWRAKLARWIGDAAAGGAALAVLPEYASMELTSALSTAAQGDLDRQLDELQALVPAYVETCAAVARQHGLYLLAGSLPERVGAQVRNRARLHGPGGDTAIIDKLQMTRFEAERWGIAPGDGQQVIDTGLGPIGVAICYDSEFPLLVRRLTAAGATLVLVPSCTDSLAGYWRVRIACQARALESQCVVVQAPTVGAAPWSIAVDANVGAAGVFAPPDRGFPDDGLLALGERDRPGWVFADVDLEAVARVRADGSVLNHRDWDQPRHLDGEVVRSRVR